MQAGGSVSSSAEAGLQPASRQATAQAGSSGGGAAERGDSGVAVREASDHLRASAGSPTPAGTTDGGPTSAGPGDWAGFGWGEGAGVGGAWPDSAGDGSARSAADGAPVGAGSPGQTSGADPTPLSTDTEAAAVALPCDAPEWHAFDAPSGGAPAVLGPLQPSEAVPHPAGAAESVPVAEDTAGSAAASHEGLGGVVPAEEFVPWHGDAADAAGACSGMPSESGAAGELASALACGGALSRLAEGARHEHEPSDWGRAGDPLAALFPTTGLPSEPAAMDRQSSWGSFGGAGSPGRGSAGPPADAWQVEGGSAEGSTGGAGLPEGAWLQGMGSEGGPLGARPEVVGEPRGGPPLVSGSPGVMGAGPHPDGLLGDAGSCDAYWKPSRDAREAGVNTLGNGHAGAVSAHVPTSRDDGPEAPAAAGGAWGSAEGCIGGALARGDCEVAVHGASDQQYPVTNGAVSSAERAVGGAAAAGFRVSVRQPLQGLPLQGTGSSNGGCHQAACAKDEGLAIPDLTCMLADALDERWVVRGL